MSEKDAVSITYFKDKERFADLLNGYFFSGEEIVSSGDISEKDRIITRTRKKKGQIRSQRLERDVVRRVKLKMQMVLVALENQTDIHYAMPVRVLNEDGINYYEQWKETGKKHRDNKDLKGAEFLSGYSKADKMIPVLTIVLYFGEELWDGPKHLKDMMDLDGLPETLRNLIADYPLHILEVRKYPYIERFRTDLQLVFGFFQNMSEAQILKQYVEAHKEEFRKLREDAYDLITVMSDFRQLKELKDQYKDEEGVRNMSNAVDRMLEKYKREEREQGIKQGEKAGIEFTRKIFGLAYGGMSHAGIAKECNVSVKKVKKILDGIM